MKTIGVIGGLGPQATMDFEERVHRVSQRLIPRRANSGYPPMVVYYHRSPPFVTEDGTRPVMPFQPDPELLEVVRKLGAIADFLVITANGPHVLQRELEEASGRKILSMQELTLGEVMKRGLRKVGVLTFVSPLIYAKPLEQMGVPHETIDQQLQERLDRAILELMAGSETAESRAVAVEAVEALRAVGTDGIILGCTEIPLLLGEATEAADLINPIELLAEAAVRQAME